MEMDTPYILAEKTRMTAIDRGAMRFRVDLTMRGVNRNWML